MELKLDKWICLNLYSNIPPLIEVRIIYSHFDLKNSDFAGIFLFVAWIEESEMLTHPEVQKSEIGWLDSCGVLTIYVPWKK